MLNQTHDFFLLCFAALTISAGNIAHAAITAPSKPASAVVEPFAPSQVQLLESPFKAAMERNAKYLLEINADRLLHNTRKYARLEPKAPLYGGWESQGIAGHTLGHYLTAISQQYAATGDARFKARLDYIIAEMAEAQKAYGDGYIGALPPVELSTLRGFKTGKIELNGAFFFKSGAWVPWYTQHKVLAGLKDAWVLGGNQQAKDVMLGLADFSDDVTRPLSHEQMQKMLQVEFGGMNETFADIYALTGNKKYLEASRRFYHEAILNPLLEGRDELPGSTPTRRFPKSSAKRAFTKSPETKGPKNRRVFLGQGRKPSLVGYRRQQRCGAFLCRRSGSESFGRGHGRNLQHL